MNLREQQAEFLVMLSKLVAFATITGKRLFILELYRTKERQEQLYKEGKTKTLNSKHLSGLAVDLVILNDEGQPVWFAEAYRQLGEFWEKLGGRWGGNFKDFKDAIHFEYLRS